MNPVAAQRWIARAKMDENSCQPCKDNNGRLYKNRADAYADYPGGSGYVKCEGRTNCRCTVVKRGKANADVNPDLISKLIGMQSFSGRALAAQNLAKLGAAVPALDTEPGFRMAAPVTDQNASLYIYDAIGGWDGIQAIDVVRALAGVTGDLDVHINSGGGSIFEGSAIFNAIANYRGGEKTAYIDGVAASAASFIMLACDEVVAEENAVVMVHDGSGIAIGTADDIRELADVLDMLSDTIANTYAKRAGGSATEWRQIMRSGDKWYNAEAAVESGLVDRVARPDEDTQDGGNTNTLDLAIFTASEKSDDDSVGSLSHDDISAVTPLAAIDVAGLREMLKGAFA